MKKLFVYACLFLIASGIVTVFRKQELINVLPAPVPPDWNLNILKV